MSKLPFYLLIFSLTANLYADQTTIENKWIQPPDMTIIGRDVYDVFPVFLADDWLCENGLPITDIHWWGSYIGFDQNSATPVNQPLHPDIFLLSQHSDVPVGDPTNLYGYSYPGLVLNFNSVNKGQYSVNYYASIDKGGGVYEHVYQFNYILPQAWTQEQGKIYWLDMSAIYFGTGSQVLFPYGWHTSDTNNLDHFVTNLGAPAPGWIIPTGDGYDLAFELTVPEPSIYFLFLFGCVMWFYKRIKN